MRTGRHGDRRWSWGLGLAVVWTGLAALSQAAPPWQNLVPVRTVSNRTVKGDMSLRDENGPWMILAAVFSGEEAEQDATALVSELRDVYKLPAYLYREHFDFTQSVEGLGVDKFNKPRRMRYAQAEAFDEIAVLVGNFSDVEDPSVELTLKQIKELQPKCMKKADDDDASSRFSGLQAYKKLVSRNGGVARGPLSKAFVTRNPLLPQEYFVPQGVDKLTLDMNRDVEYSLLKCPGNYSIRVATFGGKVVIDQKKVQAIDQGEEEMGSRLEEAAMKANKLTKALRKRGVEAYEFHDRHESIVTVGSFQKIGDKMPNGQIDLDPEVYKVISKFSAQRREFAGKEGVAMAGLEPRKLDGIVFDVQPIPVQVPKRSIATDYVRSKADE